MRSFRLGSLFGVPLQLDLTFLLVLPLFAWVISTQVGRYVELLNDVLGAAIPAEALVDPALTLVVGVVAAVGLFAGVVLHELGHSLVAMRFGFHIESITLWLFGGVAKLGEVPEDWRQELLIAVAGPVVSLGLGAGAYAAFLVTPSGLPVVRFLLGYLSVMNLALAAFNMLPGFPMDGGRVLRALLATSLPYARATRYAAEVGKLFALLLGLFGLFGGGGIFLVAIAFFIYIGAASEARQTVMRAAFEGVTVGDIMTPAAEVRSVVPEDSVADLLDQMFRQRHTGYPVVEDGEVVGLVALEDAMEVNEVEREAFRVREVMSTDLRTVAPGADVMDALTRLQEDGVDRLLVMDGDDLVGLIIRSDIMTALTIIKRSGAYRGERPGGENEPLGSTPERF